MTAKSDVRLSSSSAIHGGRQGTNSMSAAVTSNHFAPSTATTSTAAIATNGAGGTSKQQAHFDAQVIELSTPTPQSLTLVAALQLLDPFDTTADVFLMTRSYLQNWLIWAYHQQISKSETARVDAALRLAADRFGLVAPQDQNNYHVEGDPYADPGPIDASFLSLSEGDCNDLLLSPNVVVKDGTGSGSMSNSGNGVVGSTSLLHQYQLDKEFPELLRRVKSLPTDQSSSILEKKTDSSNGIVGNGKSGGHDDDETTEVYEDYAPEDGIDVEGGNLLCCAVPERFYETLRSVHGVICDDGFSVSFQPYPNVTPSLIHHQCFAVPATSKIDDTINEDDKGADPSLVETRETIETTENGHAHSNNYQNGGLASADGFGGTATDVYMRKTTPPRPIEFRRRILMNPAIAQPKYGQGILSDTSSPMTKLLKEQERLAPPRMVPTVEVYPIKLNYTIVDAVRGTNGSEDVTHASSSPLSETGFVLVSRRTRVYDALHDLLKVTAPKTASSCKRVWSHRESGTKSGDGYEVIDLASLDGKRLRINADTEGSKDHIPEPKLSIPSLLVGEWIQTHQRTDDLKELDVLIEIKRPNLPWPRESLELENRIQVGDFVDAQDIAGKWYEAVVREVTDTTVKVHYFGWASRWDATLRRRRNCPEPRKAMNPRLHPPAPLWSHSKRWRDGLKEGNLLEVRDSMSRADRPKWYKGIVKRVGPKRGHIKQLEGGAQLELLQDILGTGGPEDNGEECNRNMPLLLLGRNRHILVEVEQERQNTESNIVPVLTDDNDSLISVETTRPQPPFLRWVSLYGEEICEAGTHLKIERDGDLTVVTLRYEYEAGRKPVEVMKSWNGMYGQGLVKEALRGTPPAPGAVGMHNLGNSCFLNSIVQCLNHIDPLTQYFLNGDYVKDLNRKNPLGSGGRVATAYATLLKEVWSGDYSALAPRLLKQTVAMFAPQFNNSYQHDSQEFCQFLMDGLHEDCNRVISKPYVEELEGFGMEDEKAAVETWRKHLLRHDSILVDRCQGMHRSHLTCPSCGRESIKFDVFSTISLPLIHEDKGSGGPVRVEDCIEKFLEGEQLDELNAWYCPGCKKHVCALKMIALWSVPDILILHLKRFQFDHCSVSNNLVRSKIDDTIKFPVDGLDMRKHVLGPISEDAPPVYNLFGVSEHMGATANSGHYTATVRNCKDGRWYRYNDAHVGETTGDAAVTGGAYLLFYQRAKGAARWAGMEKLMEDRSIDPYGGLETDQDGFKVVKTKKKTKPSIS